MTQRRQDEARLNDLSQSLRSGGKALPLDQVDLACEVPWLFATSAGLRAPRAKTGCLPLEKGLCIALSF